MVKVTVPESDIWTLEETSRRLFVTTRTLQKWMRGGKLEPVEVGRAVYIQKDSAIRLGLELGMTEAQILDGNSVEDEYSDPRKLNGPPRFKPTEWESVQEARCKRCGKSTARGWCLTC